MSKIKTFSPICPIPITDYPNVLLAHGSGGKLMHQLIEKIFLPAFQNPYLEAQHDGAVIPLQNTKLAFTTDSYVVRPLFFPGGDIGTLAVNGTVNDLAMCGAKLLYLSAGFILEEGFSTEKLWRIAQSMKIAANQAGVQLVTGDTKVVDKGKGDGVFINTSGIGIVEHKLVIGPRSVQTGDKIILSGDIGRHGMAIMAVREGLCFESEIQSDCASLAGLVLSLLERGIEIHCMRDLTRGGLATALNEIAKTASLHLEINEGTVPVREDVQSACEILGLDPLYVANEGRFIAFVPASEAHKTLEVMNAHSLGAGAAIIGEVKSASEIIVTMINRLGTTRILDMLSGEQLPRIC